MKEILLVFLSQNYIAVKSYHRDMHLPSMRIILAQCACIHVASMVQISLYMCCKNDCKLVVLLKQESVTYVAQISSIFNLCSVG